MGKSKDRALRLFAGGLLLAMAGLYAAARHWQVPALQAFAEAALIGGLADWFAVTALFRRPLGLPIPHTGLIPRHTDRLGRALGDFVRDNFLAPELVAARLRRAGPADWLAQRLARPAVARGLARRLLGGLDDDDLRAALLGLFRPGPPLARLLRQAVRRDWHLRLFDTLVAAARQAVAEDDSVLHAMVAAGSGRWVPDWLGRKLTDRARAALDAGLDDLERPDHPWRQRLGQWAETVADRLDHDPAWAARLARLRDRLIQGPALAGVMAQADLAPALTEAIVAQGRRLQADGAARARLDRRLIRLAERTLIPYRQDIGAFIAEVVAGWDARTIADKLEAQVGGDLQFIRVNGTIVGGLVGLLLHVLATLLER